MLALQVCRVRIVRVEWQLLTLVLLFFGDVDDPVGRFSVATSHGLLKHLGFFDLTHPVVIVLAPDTLIVVLNVRVVMTALCRAVVDTDTVQIVRHLLEGDILILKQVLLVLDLLLQAADLILDVTEVLIEHLLE